MYRLGEVGTGTISHDLNRWWARMRGKEDPYAQVGQINDRTQKRNASSTHSPILPFTRSEAEYVYALKDINFEVQQGEVLGIIGKNGAGKSTLLKLLSKITAPTTGNIKARGRIASLLEVGTGMHPEMTGIENVYLNGTILGMTRAEIKAKLDDILDFAGCAKYADTPVKRYSSGMKVRLGFAVAAFLEPEILIVDEVLAVGDAEFQERAIGKMQDISRGGGRTVLFVSHNMNSVRQLCGRSILLKNGIVESVGETNAIVQQYLDVNSSGERQMTFTEQDYQDHPEIHLKSISIKTDSENASGILSNEQDLNVEIRYALKQDIKNFRTVIRLYSTEGTELFSATDWQESEFKDKMSLRGDYTTTFIIPKRLLNRGRYALRMRFDVPLTREVLKERAYLGFTIEELLFHNYGYKIAINEPSGLLHPHIKCFTEKNHLVESTNC